MTTLSLASQLEAAAAAVTGAEVATGSARAAVDDAQATEAAALAAFDASGTDPDLETLTRARLRRERAERILSATVDAEAAARRDLAGLEREGKQALMDRRIATAAAVTEALAPELRALVELHRAADAAIERIAEVLADHDEAWAEGAELAKDLGEAASFMARCPRVTLADARGLVNAAITRARKNERRESIDRWLCEQPDVAWTDARRAALEGARLTVEAMDAG